MEKYKTIILIEKIKKSLELGKCEEALEVADRIDKKKIKNMSDLSTIAECYFQNRKYEQAKELFLRMYEKNHSRRIVAQLVHLSIKLQDKEGADRYLTEFIKIAPEDFYRYIFQYSIDKMNKVPIVKLIEDLEGLKKTEYIESWAYELAKLYHKAGLKDQCVAECNDIVLWFGDGDYVDRAKALRAYYLGELDASVCEKSGISELHSSESAVTESMVTASEISEESEEIQDVDSEDAVTLEAEEAVMEPEKEENLNVQEEMNQEILDQEVPSQEAHIESEINDDEISAALAQEIDGIFDQDTEEPVQEQTESVGKSLQEEVEIEPVEEPVQQEAETEIAEEPVQEESEMKAVAEFEQINKKNELTEKDSNSSEDEEVEEEIYRLLEEERIESKTEAKTDSIKDEQRNSTEEKNVLEKVQLSIVSNEDIVEDEALLDYFERNDISLFDLFGSFTRMEKIQKQLVQSMDQALTQKSNINMIITGEPKSGKTELAKCIAKSCNRMNLISSNQVALINGGQLNEIDLMSNCDQLADCVLIIEQAAKISKDTAGEIQELIHELPNRIIILLEDTKENMDHLLQTNVSFNRIFNNRIHLTPYSLEDYMGFAYDYLTEKDYEIEKQAYAVLSDKISEIMNKERENALPAIFSLLDVIVQKSEKRSASQLRSMSESGRFEESDFMVLKREDIES